ncbi:hypothetical protein M011DRAFT_485206 [Sporormia fimetaria CBS 119925]|uniref:Uncharacterized protein n=1 Tax=Sporormia fimetaria CBS 119925 TaxID=1340428 RepID=A0A6A6VEX0_9PLEO|nr:hypothetical protein M011DRAFT_485206 [Sporormia fimetaria CBS 119925]
MGINGRLPAVFFSLSSLLSSAYYRRLICLCFRLASSLSLRRLRLATTFKSIYNYTMAASTFSSITTPLPGCLLPGPNIDQDELDFAELLINTLPSASWTQQFASGGWTGDVPPGATHTGAVVAKAMNHVWHDTSNRWITVRLQFRTDDQVILKRFGTAHVYEDGTEGVDLKDGTVRNVGADGSVVIERLLLGTRSQRLGQIEKAQEEESPTNVRYIFASLLSGNPNSAPARLQSPTGLDSTTTTADDWATAPTTSPASTTRRRQRLLGESRERDADFSSTSPASTTQVNPPPFLPPLSPLFLHLSPAGLDGFLSSDPEYALMRGSVIKTCTFSSPCLTLEGGRGNAAEQ